MENGEAALENNLTVSWKVRHRITLLASNSSSGYIPKSTCIKRVKDVWQDLEQALLFNWRIRRNILKENLWHFIIEEQED